MMLLIYRYSAEHKSETPIVFAKTIAALVFFALGSPLENQHTLAIVYSQGRDHIVVVIMHHAQWYITTNAKATKHQTFPTNLSIFIFLTIKKDLTAKSNKGIRNH